MTKEDIIRMAREQGLPETETEGVFRVNTDDLGRMLAAERNKLATWMIERGYATGHGDTTEDLLKELDWQIDERIAAEREACATLCDQMFHDWCNQEFEDEDEAYRNKPDAEDCKKAIRARGKQ